MRKIGSRELKNRLGAYLQVVRQGQTLVITDRGKAIAKLSPLDTVEPVVRTPEELLKDREARGEVRLGTRPFSRFKPVATKGKSVSRMILEDRR